MAKIEEIDTIANFNVREHCRTCSSHFDESILIPAFDEIEITTKTSTEFQLANELISLNVQIEKDDGLPQQLCINCVAQITKIHTFRLVCKEAQVKLKKLVSSNSFHLCSTNDGSKAQHGRDTTKFEIEGKKSDKTNLKFPLESKYNGSQVLDYHEIAREEPDLTACDTYFQDCDSVEDDIGEDNGEKEVLIHNGVDVADEKASMNKTKKLQNQDNEEQGNITQCPRCKYYVHSSRVKVDRYICIQLTRLNLMKEISDLKFHCFYCYDEFDTKQTLQNHILHSHPIDKPFKCEQCEEYFPTTNKRNRHSNKNHESIAGTFRCDICGKDYKNEAYLMKHKKRIHSSGNYECEICFQKFTNIHRFNYHLKSHDKSKQYKCQYCDKTFMQIPHLQYHEEIHTNSHRPYKCEKCHKRFIHKTEYKIHLKTHTNILPFVCEICERGFPAQHMLNAHKQTHLYNHQCEYCGEIFNSKGKLKTHRVSHTGNRIVYKFKKYTQRSQEWRENCNRYYRETRQVERLFDNKLLTCPICVKKFDLPEGLNRHMKVHDKSRKYACNLCHNTYSKSSHLQMHMNRIHLKTKYYDCSICQKRFLDSSSRNFHMKTHTKELLPCSHCNRKFSEKYLKFHERTHTLEYQFFCQICNKGFVLVGHLKEHYRAEHTTEETKEIEARIVEDSILSNPED